MTTAPATDSPRHPLTPSPRHPVTDTHPLASLSTDGSTRSPEFFRSVARLGIQAAEALEHAHAMGVVHRDIKPSNLMVDITLPSPARGRGAGGEGPHLWITDFGLAMTRTDTNLTMTGDLLGTLRYMSPEQVQAKHGVLDHRTDVYSLGVTLYELLTLQPAFPGDDRQKLMRQIPEEDPRPPRQLNGAIPKDLETVVLKATAKEPQSRYATAQELADDLRRFLEDKPIRAKRPDPWIRLHKWTKRHKEATIIAAIVVLAALFVAGGWKLHRDRQLREITQSVGESVAAAQAAFQAGDPAEAMQRLEAAEQRLADHRGALGALETEIQQLSQEVDRFERFLQSSEEATDGLMRSAGAKEFPLAHRALSLYHLLDDPNWSRKLDRRLLGPDQVAEIRRRAYEILVLMAEQRVRYLPNPQWGQKSGERESAVREGLSYLEKAAAFHRPTSALYYLRARCWRALGDRQTAEADDRLLAQTDATIALDHFLPAQDNSWRGDKEEAVRQYLAALRVEPDHYWSLACLASVLFGLGRHAEAVVAYTGCTAVRPDDSWAYYNRGVSHMKLGQLEEALADITRGIELAPPAHYMYSKRAVVRTRLGLEDEALADFAKAVELTPDAYCSHYWGGPDDIIADSEREHHFNLQAHAFHCRAELVWVPAGEYERAIADLTRAIELDPNNSDYYWHRAESHFAAKDYQSARTDWTKVPQDELDRPDRLNTIAWWLATCPDPQFRDPAHAVELGQRALALSPPMPGTYWNTLGVAQYRAGDFRAAIRALARSLELQGDNSCDFFFVAMARWQLDHKDEARKSYEKAVDWMKKNSADDQQLRRFRAEAAELLGVSDPPQVDRKEVMPGRTK